MTILWLVGGVIAVWFVWIALLGIAESRISVQYVSGYRRLAGLPETE